MLFPSFAVLFALAATQSPPTPADTEPLLACAADRYKAARRVALAHGPAYQLASKGMGAIAPVGPQRAQAARLRAEGDAYRAQAGSTASPAQIIASHGGQPCPGTGD